MDFVEQIEHIDKAFLSQVKTEFPTHLTEHEKTVTHAYLVLSHAVIEEQLELVFERHLQRLQAWSGSDVVPLDVARFAFAAGNWIPQKTEPSYKKRSLTGLLGSNIVNREIARTIKNNNGVSPENVEGLAKLTGLDWPDFEQRLSSELADLKTLTSKRGEAGHLSPFTPNAEGLSWQDYPENVREWVGGGRDAVIAIQNHLRESFYTG